MLIEHRIHDVDECLVAVEETMPTREQVAFEPALALVLAEHLHHAAGGSEKFIVLPQLGVPLPLRHLEDGTQSI